MDPAASIQGQGDANETREAKGNDQILIRVRLLRLGQESIGSDGSRDEHSRAMHTQHERTRGRIKGQGEGSDTKGPGE